MIFLDAIFVMVCGLLMLSVLLQSGKGEGLSGTFGGSAQFMGGRAAATFLTKATTSLAAAFMVLCIVLSVLSSSRRASAGRTEAQRRMMQTPAAQVAPTPGTSQPAPAQGTAQPAPAKTVPGGAE
jgi:preprotein translocase subunit SecG